MTTTLHNENSIESFVIDTLTELLERTKKYTSTIKTYEQGYTISTDGWKHDFETEDEDYKETLEFYAKENNVTLDKVRLGVDGDYITVYVGLDRKKTEQEINREIEKNFEYQAFSFLVKKANKIGGYERKPYNDIIFKKFFKEKNQYQTFIEGDFNKIIEYYSTIFIPLSQN